LGRGGGGRRTEDILGRNRRGMNEMREEEGRREEN
jgi:hypothetical protein